MAGTSVDEAPLTFDDVMAWFHKGSKPADQWRVGAEHEKFVFRLGSHDPVPYEGPAGIKALLEGMKRFGWPLVRDGIVAPQAEYEFLVLGPHAPLISRFGTLVEPGHDVIERQGSFIDRSTSNIFLPKPHSTECGPSPTKRL